MSCGGCYTTTVCMYCHYAPCTHLSQSQSGALTATSTSQWAPAPQTAAETSERAQCMQLHTLTHMHYKYVRIHTHMYSTCIHFIKFKVSLQGILYYVYYTSIQNMYVCTHTYIYIYIYSVHTVYAEYIRMHIIRMYILTVYVCVNMYA